MTGEERTLISLNRYRLGTVLIWIGVLTWLPFMVLRGMGYKPSLFLFLPFHLAGVVGGARLRNGVRKESGAGQAKKSRLQMLGHLLILTGIMVWAPYFYLKLVVQSPVQVSQFLPYHLACILSGGLLLWVNFIHQRKSK